MTQQELLLALKDISPPGEPDWWLLAPGYLAILLLVIVVIATFWLWLIRRRAHRMFSAARLELAQIKDSYAHHQDSQRLARELALWLKQVALQAYPERQLEGATGSSWLRFLDSCLGDNSFTRGDGRFFGDAIYQLQASFEADRMLLLTERWLQAVKPRLLQRGRN